MKVVCIPIAKYGLHYNTDICPATIDQQFRDSFLHMLFDEYFTTLTFCTFEMEVCDMDKWEKLNLDDFVDEKLAAKPDHLKGNDYLNSMY